MPDDEERIEQLLRAALESLGTPDEACAGSPDLLPEVRRRWEHCRRVAAELDAMFPAAPRSTVAAGGVERPAAGLPEIPGYAVEAVLGRGGMGVVYRARHVRLKRTVALKMLLSGAYAGAPERARFLREAQAVAALRHPHVVQVHDVGEHDGRPYFTMEWVDGGTLAEKLAGVPQPAAEAAALVATLADAVEAAHRCGIVHRDLKPTNVLLGRDGTVKVSDFGLARHVEGEDALTLTGARLGTPSYMAPEQAAGRHAAVGPATDVYGLGAILYEVLTGRPPFRGESAAETERQVIAEDPAPPSRLNARVPRDLETVCLKCLRKDPARRYPAAAALAEDLRRFSRGEPVAARPVRPPERVAKWARRRPAAAVAIVGGALALGAASGGGLWLLASRAATARLVEEDLQEFARHERRGAWGEARTPLERARGRLGDGGPAALRDRVARGERDLQLVARLDAIRLDRATGGTAFVDFISSYHAYAAAFREAGLGAPDDDPAAVAERIKGHDIRAVLVAALDDWVLCTSVEEGQNWLMAVARRADGDPTDWRARARDPKVWTDKAALARLVGDVSDDPSLARLATPAGDAPVRLLETLGRRTRSTLGDAVAVPFLTRVQRAHPSDFWVNYTLGEALYAEGRWAEAARNFQAAVAVRPDVATGHDRLGEAFGMDYRTDEAIAQFRQAARLSPTWYGPAYDAGITFGRLGRHEEALVEFREAARLAPKTAPKGEDAASAANSAPVHYYLGRTLTMLGRDAEAVEPFRRAIALDPRNANTQLWLRTLYFTLGRREEALALWRKSLEADPAATQPAWQGYAELCLFLGHEDEYRRVRSALLSRFGGARDANIAERTGRACLLLPGSEDEVRRSTDLIDRAVATTKAGSGGPRPYFMFAKGLAEYRVGRWESAAAIMRGEASPALGPAPRLVLAMALHRLGHPGEARATLAEVVLANGWTDEGAKSADEWMYHVLRREAERLVLPELPAFLAGAYQPRDQYERIAMTGACQFAKRYVARARLWSDLLAAEPSWAADCRTFAACTAVQAACDAGSDTGTLTDADRARLRAEARGWMRAEVAAADATLKGGDVGKQRLLTALTVWSTAPEMAGARDPARLALLPAAEQAEWTALWGQVNAALGRVRAQK